MVTDTSEPLEPTAPQRVHAQAEAVSVVEYMYRDASNYKNHATFAVLGEITADIWEQLSSACDPELGFIPTEVHMPELYSTNPSHYDDDHPWHELTGYTVVHTSSQAEARSRRRRHPHDAATETVQHLLSAFQSASWDPVAAQEQVEEWKRSTPRGPLYEV